MTEPPRLVPDARELRPVMGSASLFGGLEPLVYVNHAGISPASAVVRKAVATLLADYGRRGAAAYPTWAAQRRRLKGKLATLVGAASPDEIALSPNTSRGISDVALSFPWERGDRVVLFDGEFPANVVPWLRAAETFGVEPVFVDGRAFRTSPDAAFAALDAALARGRVRVVAVSAVAFQTGFCMPVARIGEAARRAGAKLFVDAVQACGAVPVDVRGDGIDFLACGSHKWLMGVEGAGFVYASEENARLLVPRTTSWLGLERATDFLFEGPGLLRYDKPAVSGIAFLEGGNVSATAFAALEASLDLLLELGPGAIGAHVQAIHDAIEPRAVELGFTSVRAAAPEGRSGSLSLLPPSGVELKRLHEALARLGVACAMPDGHLRISPHWWNAVDEADQIVLSLGEALREVR